MGSLLRLLPSAERGVGATGGESSAPVVAPFEVREASNTITVGAGVRKTPGAFREVGNAWAFATTVEAEGEERSWVGVRSGIREVAAAGGRETTWGAGLNTGIIGVGYTAALGSAK